MHFHQLYTLGYSGLAPQELLAFAQREKALVVDVRLSPLSRRAGWAQPALRELLGERYRHVPAFGNRNYKNDGPIALADPGAGFEQVRPWLEQDQPLILLCVCEHWQHCHRRNVAEYIEGRLSTSEVGITIHHLQVRALKTWPEDQRQVRRVVQPPLF